MEQGSKSGLGPKARERKRIPLSRIHPCLLDRKARIVQQGTERQIVQLVRGEDDYGNFEIVAPPSDAASAAEVRQEADRRVLRNVYPVAKEPA